MKRSDRKNLKKQLEQIEVPGGLKKINKMSLNFVLPLVLFYSEGMSYDEIAQTLKLPQSTVRGRIHRAKAELRKELDAE